MCIWRLATVVVALNVITSVAVPGVSGLGSPPGSHPDARKALTPSRGFEPASLECSSSREGETR